MKEGPTYARFKIRSAGREREYRLGPANLAGSEATALNWETAPLAEVFFRYAPGETYELEHDGRVLTGVLLEKTLVPEPVPVRLTPRSPEARRRPRLGLRVALDEAQQRAVLSPRAQSMLLLGEAGFGKTTVALHRIAHLATLARAEGRNFHGLVLVPGTGLRALCRELLFELGFTSREIEVETTDAWILREARRVFPKIPARDSSGASAAVIRRKRDRSLRELLPVIAARRRGSARRSDLLHLFGERAWMNAEVIAHTQVQFTRRTEKVYAHVDADRLRTLDERELDAGTPLEDAETIDAEDAPVLFEIHRLRTGAPAALTQYDHVVADEAQELAPLELAVIGCAVAPGGSLTIAGDHRQQTDDTACFESWEQSCKDLGAFTFDRVELKESYRSPPDVVRYARALFEEAPASSARFDPRQLLISSYANELTQTYAILDAVQNLDDPRAAVVVICKNDESAQRTRQRLERGQANIQVATVEAVKGLEFDYVILPEHDTLTTRELYVAATRASHQLWIPRSFRS